LPLFLHLIVVAEVAPELVVSDKDGAPQTRAL
jgi:hypothetical protein